jgi:hypothetical protein
MKATNSFLAIVSSVMLISLACAQEVIRETPSSATVQTVEVGGTIAQLGDTSIALKTESSIAPVQFRFVNTTQWVDEAGNVVTRETVRAGAPVTLQYSKGPDGLLISKVIVRKSPTANPTVQEETVTTTTTAAGPMEVAGTVSQFGDGYITMSTAAAPNPVQYLYSDTTKWMDESGNIVPREIVRTGVPITIYYTKSPQGLVTSKVVVRRGAAPPVVQRTETEVIETPAAKANQPKKTVVVEERKPIKPAAKKKVVVEEKTEPVVVERPAPPAVIEKKTTTTTTTQKKKKTDDDDDDDDEDDD